MSTFGKRIAMLAVAAMFVAGVAIGQDRVWVGADGQGGPGHWLIDSNWNPEGQPSSSEQVQVKSPDAIVTVDDEYGEANITVQRLYLDEGVVTVDTAGSLTQSYSTIYGTTGDDATFNLVRGTVSARDYILGDAGGSNVTFNMQDGFLDLENFNIGRNGATGTFNMHGGDLYVNHAAGDQGDINVGWGEGSTGTFNRYGGGVDFLDRKLWIGRDSATGTYRAWLDGTEDAFDIGDADLETWDGTSNLDVAFPGGVMQSSIDSFDLIKAGSRGGSWDNAPDHLWDVSEIGGNVVTVSLDGAEYQRGTLDPSNIGETTPMGSTIYGFIEWDNQENATATEILLDFAWDGSGSESDTWDRFIADLGDEGYTVLDQNFDETNPWAQLELDLDGEATEYFTWDLSEYTGSAQLQVNGMEVVPEPSSLLLLGLASLLLMKPRRRRA